MPSNDGSSDDYPITDGADDAIVFAFDRDHTVDVNPPGRGRDAVPLSWVRHLAHRTHHVVFATGNQRLKDEAEIPGTAEIVRAHPSLSASEAGNVHFNNRLSRRERVRSLGHLYPAARRRIVVDDVDLADMDDWTHYFPWDFYDAVRAGDVLRDVSLDPD